MPAGSPERHVEAVHRAGPGPVRVGPVPRVGLPGWPGAIELYAGGEAGPLPEAAAAGAVEALQGMRSYIESEVGRRLYGRRAGIEGTLSQGVRSFGLRRARYRGTAKAHLQQVVTATAINFSRVSDGLEDVPRAATRTLAVRAAGGLRGIRQQYPT